MRDRPSCWAVRAWCTVSRWLHAEDSHVDVVVKCKTHLTKKKAMAKLDEVELTMTVCSEWAAEFAKEGHAKTPSKPSCAACTWRR